MSRENRFGGIWTEKKLMALKDYLSAYMRIFSKNEPASWFQTTYLDAFAGTPYRSAPETPEINSDSALFDLYSDQDVQDYKKGSALIALETDPPFDKYLFVEQKQESVKQLGILKDQVKGKIQVVHGEANEKIREWCRETDWQKNRAVVFLDPYGMQVEWQTIIAIAETKGIDLWLLFPLGQAVLRLLMRKQPPEGAWAERLTKFFGTEDWREAFYSPVMQLSLSFDDTVEEEQFERNVGWEKVEAFFLACDPGF